MTLAERLKEARAALRLKQEELAAQSGVSYSAYQKYEIGRSAPGADALEGFVRAGINANWLLTGEGSMLLTGEELRLNRGAVSAILKGLLSVHRDPELIAEHLCGIYEDAYNTGEITEDDVGEGQGHKAA